MKIQGINKKKTDIPFNFTAAFSSVVAGQLSGHALLKNHSLATKFVHAAMQCCAHGGAQHCIAVCTTLHRPVHKKQDSAPIS